VKKSFEKLTACAPRCALSAIGAIVIISALTVAFTSNFNICVLLTFTLGAVLLAWGIFYGWTVKVIHRRVRRVAVVMLVTVLAFISVIILYGKLDNATYREDAVIVLGASIHGETPSSALKNRLDRAVEYYENNPDAVIVVSGGRGPQEDITEALAMERYLIERGVPAERILKEERATSTRENFAYSKELLDSYFEGEYSVAFVTDDYHIYRAVQYANMEGYGYIPHCHSTTNWFLRLPSCLRECLAIMKLWVLRR